MATGIGKGRIIHLTLERQFRIKPNSKVLVVAGTKNILVSQTHRALSDYQQITFNQNNTDQILFNGSLPEFKEIESVDDLTEESEDILGDETLEDRSFLYQ